MKRDRSEVDIAESDSRSSTFDRGQGGKVIEDVAREVNVDRGRVLFRNGGYEHGVAKEELQVNREGIRVLRVLEPKRMKDRRAINMRLVEGGVKVVQKAITGIRVRYTWKKATNRRPTEY